MDDMSMRRFLSILGAQGTSALLPEDQTIIAMLERFGLIRFDDRSMVPTLTPEGQAVLDAVGEPQQ